MGEDSAAGQPPVSLEWFTIEQAAAWLQVSTKTIRRYIEAGSLPAVNLGGRAIRIRRVDLEGWLETRRIEPGVSLRQQERLERRQARLEKLAQKIRAPRWPTAEELSGVNVSLTQANPLLLRCNACGTTWAPRLHSSGKLARKAWCCPTGCNCPD